VRAAAAARGVKGWLAKGGGGASGTGRLARKREGAAARDLVGEE